MHQARLIYPTSKRIYPNRTPIQPFGELAPRARNCKTVVCERVCGAFDALHKNLLELLKMRCIFSSADGDDVKIGINKKKTKAFSIWIRMQFLIFGIICSVRASHRQVSISLDEKKIDSCWVSVFVTSLPIGRPHCHCMKHGELTIDKNGQFM